MRFVLLVSSRISLMTMFACFLVLFFLKDKAKAWLNLASLGGRLVVLEQAEAIEVKETGRGARMRELKELDEKI